MTRLTVDRDGRLDVLITSSVLTRSQAARLIRAGHVRVNGKVVVQPSFLPKSGDIVEIYAPEATEAGVEAQDIPISLLYEDDALAVVVKPHGMVVHPAAGNPDGTLVNALLHRLTHLSGIGGEKRPGIVHRLDKDTSGILLVAKNDQAHVALSRALAERRIDKYYYALVAGGFREDQGEVNAPIARSPRDRKKMAFVPGGREAVTQWQVARRDKDRTLLLIRLVTGRTHQIRVHMASIGHPVLGDPLYGGQNAKKAPRLMLHAAYVGFAHPVTGDYVSFYAPPEASFGALPDAGIFTGFPVPGPSWSDPATR